VLPAIAKRLKGKVLITTDGGVRTGYDVLKMLALAPMPCSLVGMWRGPPSGPGRLASTCK